MSTQDTRPVNLDLTKFRFPITAIASIAHRICAVISWVGMGLALYAINLVHTAPQNYHQIADLLTNNSFVQFVCWGILSSFGYYCLATIKHLAQDLGFFEDFQGGQKISWAVLILGALLAMITGAYIWA